MSGESDVTQVVATGSTNVVTGSTNVVTGSTNIAGYESIITEANKPKKLRKACITNRAGELVVPRRHSLLEDKLQEKKEIWASGTFPNPYRAGGKYWAFIEALNILGINQRHSYNDVKATMKELLSGYTDNKGKTAWEKFDEVTSDNNDNLGKDLRGKIIQNAQVLQRIGNKRDKNPYGYKLYQLGCVIDILVNEAGGLSFRMRTGTQDLPINEISRKGRKGKEKKENLPVTITGTTETKVPDMIISLIDEKSDVNEVK
jgi:hypothetical protein